MSPNNPAPPEEDGPIVLPPPRHRTVMGCEDEISLRWALMEPPASNRNSSSSGSCPLDPNVLHDWQTPLLDLNTCTPQNLNEEVKRLMALKEYSILDCEQEEKFERITALAGRIFEAPICLVSLVDIGRQWFMSNRGLGDVRETSRQVSFCAHAIQSKDEDIFVVPETHEDERFVNNGLVTGPPFIRFYAGVPLKSPEGYKLGTFCIIDTKPRPQGLSLSEKQNLRELTAMTLDTMVERKQEMKRIRDEKTRLMACAAHDLMSPLTGIRLNLELLMEESKKLDSHQKDLIKSSLQCSEIIERICRTTIEGFRGERDGDAESDINKEEGHVVISELVKNVNRIVSIYPKKVPLFIDVDENVPKTIVSDDLKLFRSILNYLTNACKYTEQGSIHLRIYTKKAGDKEQPDMELGGLPGSLMTPMTDVLVVECEDTGQGIALEKLATLFTPLADVETNDIDPESKVRSSGLGLYSVANEIGSLGGNYGVFPREDLSGFKECIDGQSISGSIFWFTIPLVKSAARLCSMSEMDTDERLTPLHHAFASTNIASASSLSSTESMTRLKRPLDKSNSTFPTPKRSVPLVPPSTVTSPKKASERKKCVLVIDDSITIRKALSKGFERLGFMVDEAENGHRGLNYMKQKQYDLVMCDFLMPIMDGVDVARKIRAWEQVSRPWYHQHIVGLSAHANGKDAEAGLKAGMDRFMSKPIPVKTLKDLIDSKPVVDGGYLLDSRYEQSYDVMEAVCSKCDSLELSESSDNSKSKQNCLIVESNQDTGAHSLQRLVELNGWKSVVVSSGEDALRLLKMRNWGCVIIDNDLPFFSGINCIARFRDWEKYRCISKQKHVYILSECYNPFSLPDGFDGALKKPFEPAQVAGALERAKHSASNSSNVKTTG